MPVCPSPDLRVTHRYRDDFALVARARVAAVAWRARSGQTAEPGVTGDG